MWLLQMQFLLTLLTKQLSVKVRAIFARIHRTVALLHREKVIKLNTHFPLSFFFFFLARSAFCLAGWSYYRGNCYFVGHDAESWANAEVGTAPVHMFMTRLIHVAFTEISPFAELLCQLRCQSGLSPQHLGVRFPPGSDEEGRPQLCLDRRVLFRGLYKKNQGSVEQSLDQITLMGSNPSL